jgi:hypothetical protein
VVHPSQAQLLKNLKTAKECKMKLVLYILLWVFCWPLALLITVLDFLNFASKQAEEKKKQEDLKKMMY